MEEILSRLRTLSSDQLREEVIGAGLKCGPVTDTTRALFEKKLARTVLERRMGVVEADALVDGAPPEEETLSEPAHIPHSIRFHDKATPLHYYGVCPPLDHVPEGSGVVHVYDDDVEAMKAVRMMRGARFKMFSTREEAEKFSQGALDSCPSPCKAALDVSPGKQEGHPCVDAERANTFRTPRTQDLTGKLRKAVEAGNVATFRELVWNNPRYLIGSGDNPTLVQEGCRYNVLHVAAKENQPDIAQLLLDTLENPEFMSLMYPDDQKDMLWKRIHYIVDLYLNTPDKVAFETPLHFACKFGSPEVVEVLCSHPVTDKNRKNKNQQTPASIICERNNKSMEVKRKIKDYLEDKFYVPLLRATDNSSQSVIGALWSPKTLDTVPHWLSTGLTGSPKDPVMAVSAFAGPLCLSKAEGFRRMWKTPPRDQAEFFHKILKSDPDRGAERVGRELAHSLGYPWAEFWDFLGCFVDLSTKDGLQALEEYLNRKNHSELALEDSGKGRVSLPLGRNICNSLSVGAFLDPGNDIEKQVKNTSLRERTSVLNSPLEAVSQSKRVANKTDLNATVTQDWLCPTLETPVHTSPVSNLLAEFKKVAVLSQKAPGNGEVDGDLWDVSSSSSDEYFTAEEESTEELPRASGCSASSSTSSYQSLDSSEEDHCIPRNLYSARRGLFVDGETPTRLDREVPSALTTADIDPQKYPSIAEWKHTILAYSSGEMQSWPGPKADYPWSCVLSTPGRHPTGPDFYRLTYASRTPNHGEKPM